MERRDVILQSPDICKKIIRRGTDKKESVPFRRSIDLKTYSQFASKLMLNMWLTFCLVRETHQSIAKALLTGAYNKWINQQ